MDIAFRSRSVLEAAASLGSGLTRGHAWPGRSPARVRLSRRRPLGQGWLHNGKGRRRMRGGRVVVAYPTGRHRHVRAPAGPACKREGAVGPQAGALVIVAILWKLDTRGLKYLHDIL